MMHLKGIAIASHPPAVIPEVGRGRELLAEKTVRGLKDLALETAKIKPETIVCITPHGNIFRDGVSVLYDTKLLGNLSSFGAAEVQMEKTCDMGLLNELNLRFADNDCCSIFINPKTAEVNGLSMELDHGVMIPLYYIDKVFPEYKMVHITIGDLSLYELYQMGRILREAIEINKKRTVILACADLSHALKDEGPYGYHPKGELFDTKVVSAVSEKSYYDLLTMPADIYEPAKQCGLRPIVMALGATDSINTDSKIMAYEAPFGVGYMEAMITFNLSGDDPTNESLLNRLDREIDAQYTARKSNADAIASLVIAAAEKWVTEGRALNTQKYLKKIKNNAMKKQLSEPAGVFITIEKGMGEFESGELRGCMGTLSPVTPSLAEEIVRNTIEATSYDPRFLPVEVPELKQLKISVSIIGAIEEIEELSCLDPKNYGLILEKGMHRGVLLPDLPGIDTAEKQVFAARRKAGLPETEPEGNDWEDQERIYRFAVEKHV